MSKSLPSPNNASESEVLDSFLALAKLKGIDPTQLLREAQSQAKPREVVTTSPPSRKKVAVFSSNFDPPSRYHREVATKLLAMGFDEVIVAPSGPRPLKGAREHAPAAHRAALTTLAFRGLPAVTVDFSDLDDGVFSSFEQQV